MLDREWLARAAFRRGSVPGICIDDLNEPTFLLGALVHEARTFGDLLSEDREFALRTRNRERFVPKSEGALRPFVATVKDTPVSRLLLAELSVSADWAVNAHRDSGGVFAVGVIRAR